MREETEFRPKPMIEIGGKPVLWHIMKLYSHFGFTDFVVYTGYKGHVIKDFFHNYSQHTRDFTTKLGDGGGVQFHGKNGESDWSVTVADTGPTTATGGRLLQVRKYLDEATFMCTYGDGLAPVDLSALLRTHQKLSPVATMTVTRQRSRFGVASIGPTGIVRSFAEKPLSNDPVNIGYFVFEPKIFDFLDEDLMLENQPLHNLVTAEALGAFQHDGFWQPMDTYREYLDLNTLWDEGQATWKVW